MNELYLYTLSVILEILPYSIALFGGILFFDQYKKYRELKYKAEQKFVLLEIFPPREVFKSPAAMELFFNCLHQTGGDKKGFLNIIKGDYGGHRHITSLELISDGGAVSFIIRANQKIQKVIESQLYAQYPGIEAVARDESEDYVNKVDFNLDKINLFGMELKLTGPDPLPIKTYVDYGLDDSTLEEQFKIDPMTATLEFLGSLTAGHKVWIQILVKAHKKEDPDPEKYFGKIDAWKKEAERLIQEIREKTLKENKDGTKIQTVLTKGQVDKISAIERSVSKIAFDTEIRALYIADKEVYTPMNMGALMSSFKQYNSGSLNGFEPKKTTNIDTSWYDKWFKDFEGNETKKIKKKIFDRYISREMQDQKFVLNTEELATIYHFPGQVSQTPTINRVLAKKAEPPANLPI